MITNAILTFFLNILYALIDSLPSLTFSIPEGIFNGLNSVCWCIGYFVPILQLLPILGLSFAIDGFRLAWAIIMRIKSFIPTISST